MVEVLYTLNCMTSAKKKTLYEKGYMMGSKMKSADNRTRSSLRIIVVVGLCCFFYLLGAWQRSGFGKGDSIALKITGDSACTILPTLNFETHHNFGGDIIPSESKVKMFKPCDARYTDYTPCHDQNRAMTFPRENMIYRERHCPPEKEKLHCLIPAPKGYVTPFPWPKSRDYVPFANVPYKSLTIEKAVQNWVQLEGDVLKFPGGGTMFPQGADAYIDELASVIPIADGTVRTALDTGCGVQEDADRLFAVPPRVSGGFIPGVSKESFEEDNKLWKKCEAFSTYPRSYDLIHASGVFSLYQHKCDIEDILLEMDRILRPEGTVIIRDQVDVVTKVKKLASGMRWNTKMQDHEDGPFVTEKILVAAKRYWVGSGSNYTSS
ncbi:uncharacterized protein A4U43_C10F3280 [Asparagus officinalis]|uniref:Methyltransferase n=1 Tax=Asparagus officinalis TaxID=4686 RepID=A0A5P1E3D8_ASPOF|nr:uncharacterized protein A4U43_C10F3280 [Asparagus officinalis]